MPFEMPPLVDHSYAVEMQVQECIEEASHKYNVPHLLLRAIRIKEAGTVGKVTRMSGKKSYDIGPMQINTIWLETLAGHGISEEELTNNPCANAHVGAWVLRGYFDHHNDWFKATQSYNAGYRIKNGLLYATDVFSKWSLLYQSTLVATTN